MTFKEQYEICKERRHQKSGMVTPSGWDICKYCQTYFRYLTTLEEDHVPK